MFQFAPIGQVHEATATATIVASGVNNQTVTLWTGWFPLVWYVSTTGSDETGDGSVDNPFATIQRGIYAASDGDTVLVASGTYVENVNIHTNIILTSTSGPENTIIDGNQNGKVITLNESAPSDIRMKIIGFSIQNGNSNSPGAGISLRNRSTVIENCFIINNK